MRPAFLRIMLVATVLFIFLPSCVTTIPALPIGSGETSTAIPFLSVFRHSTPTPTSTPYPIVSLPGESTAANLPSASISTVVETPSFTLTPFPTFKICSPIGTVLLSDLNKVVSDPYNPPPPGSDQRHEGVDFSYWHWKGGGPILGAPVQSVLSGKVAAALSDTFPYGNFVIIESPMENLPADLAQSLKLQADMSLYLLYAHLDKPPAVYLGEVVAACQTIGAVGRTGNAAVPHLHLETRIGPQGAQFESMSRFVENATKQEKENYLLWRVSGTFTHFDPMTLLSFPVP